MPRVSPDNNDIVVWKLDETGTPFVNSSTSTNSPGASANLTLMGTTTRLGKTEPLLQSPGPFGPGTYSVTFLGTDARAYIGGANTFRPPAPVTMSYWLKLHGRLPTNATMQYVAKQHTENVWSGITFATFIMNDRVYVDGSPGAFFPEGGINTAGSTQSYAGASDTRRIQAGMWNHIGYTYSGTQSQVFINGMLVAQSAVHASQAIVYDVTASSGPWFVGAIPTASSITQPGWYSIADVRFADVVRPQSYFQNIYEQGFLNR